MKKALSYGIRQNNSEFRIRLKCEMFDKFDSCLTFFKGFRTRNLSRLPMEIDIHHARLKNDLL